MADTDQILQASATLFLLQDLNRDGYITSNEKGMMNDALFQELDKEDGNSGNGFSVDDFMFRLIQQEKKEVIAKCEHLNNLRFSPVLPYAFTEHGAIMVATILNTEIAIQVSVQVVRAFNRLREFALTHADLARKINAMEKNYDDQFKTVFDAIRQLMAPPPSKNRKIGFI